MMSDKFTKTQKSAKFKALPHKYASNDSKFDKKLVDITERVGFKLALFSVSMMTILAGVIVSPALPAIETHFKDTANVEILTRLIVTMPALFVLLFAPVAGALVDKFGKLKFLYPSILIWTLAGCGAAFVDNLYLILVCRAVFGIATAFVMTISTTLIGDYFSKGGKDRMQGALGLQNFVMAFGGALATLAGGLLVTLSWRYIFLVYAFGFVILIANALYLFEPKFTRKKVAQAPVKMSFTPYLGAWFMGFFGSVVYYLCPTQLPFYIRDYLGLDSTFVGVAIGIPPLTYGLCALFYKKMSLKFSLFSLYAFGMVLFGVGFLIIVFIHDFGALLVAMAIIGFGSGLVYINNSAWILKLAPQAVRGKVVGILSSCIFLGQFLSPLLTQPLVASIGLFEMFLLYGTLIFIVALVFFIASRKIRAKFTFFVKIRRIFAKNLKIFEFFSKFFKKPLTNTRCNAL